MPVTAIHPGEHLAEELDALDVSAAEFARKIRVPTNRVTQILNGIRSINGDTALRPRPALRHQRPVLAQFAKPLRPAPRRAKGGQSHQRTSQTEARPPNGKAS